MNRIFTMSVSVPDNVLMRELDRESAILDLNDEKEYEVEPVTLEEDSRRIRH